MTTEEENKVIDGYSNSDFAAVLLDEFGPGGAARVMGWAALYGLTGKRTTIEARGALVTMGVPERNVYMAYADFRRLRRALLARRGIASHERSGGPGKNDGVPPIVERVRGLQTA